MGWKEKRNKSARSVRENAHSQLTIRVAYRPTIPRNMLRSSVAQEADEAPISRKMVDNLFSSLEHSRARNASQVSLHTYRFGLDLKWWWFLIQWRIVLDWLLSFPILATIRPVVVLHLRMLLLLLLLILLFPCPSTLVLALCRTAVVIRQRVAKALRRLFSCQKVPHLRPLSRHGTTLDKATALEPLLLLPVKLVTLPPNGIDNLRNDETLLQLGRGLGVRG